MAECTEDPVAGALCFTNLLYFEVDIMSTPVEPAESRTAPPRRRQEVDEAAREANEEEEVDRNSFAIGFATPSFKCTQKFGEERKSWG